MARRRPLRQLDGSGCEHDCVVAPSVQIVECGYACFAIVPLATVEQTAGAPGWNLRGRVKGFQNAAPYLEAILKRLRNGQSAAQIHQDPQLADAMGYYFIPERGGWDPICLGWSEGKGLWTHHDGRHRTEAARSVGVSWIPAHIHQTSGAEICGHPHHPH